MLILAMCRLLDSALILVRGDYDEPGVAGGEHHYSPNAIG